MEIDALFREHYPALRRYLHRLTGDPDAADDAAQEAFVRLAASERSMEHPRAWLFTTGLNLVREGARTARRRERILSGSPPPTTSGWRPDEDAERSDEVRRVRAALASLTPREGQILLMREEGFRHAEIAEAIGVAPGSVGTLLARAARRFAEVYGTSEER